MDAFKVFAKAEPAAYTEESIAASQDLPPKGAHSAANGNHANGNCVAANGSANAYGSADANGKGCIGDIGACNRVDSVNGVNGAMGAASITREGANSAFINDPKAGVLSPASGGTTDGKMVRSLLPVM